MAGYDETSMLKAESLFLVKNCVAVHAGKKLVHERQFARAPSFA